MKKKHKEKYYSSIYLSGNRTKLDWKEMRKSAKKGITVYSSYGTPPPHCGIPGKPPCHT